MDNIFSVTMGVHTEWTLGLLTVLMVQPRNEAHVQCSGLTLE